MDITDIEATVRNILAEKSYGLRLPPGFPSRDSLFAHGIIDSFGIFAFVRAIERDFPVTVRNREIHPGNFETIDAVVRFLSEKLQPKGDRQI